MDTSELRERVQEVLQGALKSGWDRPKKRKSESSCHHLAKLLLGWLI